MQPHNRLALISAVSAIALVVALISAYRLVVKSAPATSPTTTPAPTNQNPTPTVAAAEAEPPPNSLTAQYVATLPPGTAPAEMLEPRFLDPFVAAHKGELVPPFPADGAKTSTTVTTKEYVAALTKQQHASLAAIAAAYEHRRDGDNQPLEALLAQEEATFSALAELAAPVKHKDFHQRYLATVQAYRDNLKNLTTSGTDLLTAIIAVTKLHDLAPLLEKLAQEAKTLT